MFDLEKSTLAAAADLKMQINVWKGDIKKLSIVEGMAKLHDEVDELQAALSEKNYEAALLEAGDVYNYLVLVVGKLTESHAKRKVGEK